MAFLLHLKFGTTWPPLKNSRLMLTNSLNKNGLKQKWITVDYYGSVGITLFNAIMHIFVAVRLEAERDGEQFKFGHLHYHVL